MSDHTSMIVHAVLPQEPAALGDVVRAIADAGGRVRSVGTATAGRPREFRIDVGDAAHGERIAAAVAGVAGVSVADATDAAVAALTGGAIGMRNRMPLATRDDLSMAYTPGVARVCMAIHDDFSTAWTYTIKANSVMVVSDGSDVAGQGALGAEASLPACEAVCLVLRTQADIDAFPLPVDAADVDAVVNTIVRCSSVFAGVHLTSVTPDRAEAIRAALAERLDVPVRVGGEDAPDFAASWRSDVTGARAAAG